MASKQEVREFLKAFCEHLDRAGYLLVNKSDDNAACLATLGLTTKQREAIVRQLAHADYCEGPISEKGRKASAWVFGVTVEGKEIYVKLALVKTEAPLCWSFHFPKYPMAYPFRSVKR